MFSLVCRNAFLLGTAALLGVGRAQAQHQTLYQTVGTYVGETYPMPLTAPLSVVLPEPLREPELSKQHKKPDERAAYLAEIAAERSALELAAKHWKLTPVTFISEAKAQELRADKAGTHLLLGFGQLTQETVSSSGKGYSYGVPGLLLYLVGKVGGSRYLLQKSEYTSSILLYQFYWPFDRRHWQELYPGYELVPVVQQLQAFMQQLSVQHQSPRDIKKAAQASLGSNTGLLQGRTLLLSRDQLSKSLPEDKLAKYYPYPMQVTDPATLEAAVAAADARYVYVRYVTLHGENGYQLLDAATGKVLGYSDFHASHREDIGHLEDDDLKQLVKTATKS